MNSSDLTRSIMEKDARLLSRSIRIPFFPFVVRTGRGATLRTLRAGIH